jgi:hypothetical protein
MVSAEVLWGASPMVRRVGAPASNEDEGEGVGADDRRGDAAAVGARAVPCGVLGDGAAGSGALVAWQPPRTMTTVTAVATNVARVGDVDRQRIRVWVGIMRLAILYTLVCIYSQAYPSPSNSSILWVHMAGPTYRHANIDVIRTRDRDEVRSAWRPRPA